MSLVSVGPTERTGVRSQHGAGDLSIGILEVVGCVKAFTLPVVATEDAYLWLSGLVLCGQFSTQITIE